MTNWKEIHKDFAKTSNTCSITKKKWLNYQDHWEENNLTYQDAQEWIAAGFKPDKYEEVKNWKDHGFNYQTFQEWVNALEKSFGSNNWAFFAWLRDEKRLTPQAVQQKGNTESLRKEYEKNWTDVHQDFSKNRKDITANATVTYSQTYQQLWEKTNLTYQDAQEWMAIGFELRDNGNIKQWKKLNFTLQQAEEWIKAGLKPNHHGFALLAKNNGSTPQQFANFKKQRNVQESDAQVWIDFFYSPQQKNQMTKLDISGKNLTGSLDLSEFINLEELDCEPNQLTTLTLNNPQLKIARCANNNLTSLTIDNCPRLTKLWCYRNNLPNLDFLKNFGGLERLNISNNNLSGTLEPLAGLINLKNLGIENTNLTSGLEYLPDSLGCFTCRNTPLATELEKIGKLNNQMGDYLDLLKRWKKEYQIWINQGFTKQQIYEWLNAGAKVDDHGFVEESPMIGITNFPQKLKLIKEQNKNGTISTICKERKIKELEAELAIKEKEFKLTNNEQLTELIKKKIDLENELAFNQTSYQQNLQIIRKQFEKTQLLNQELETQQKILTEQKSQLQIDWQKKEQELTDLKSYQKELSNNLVENKGKIKELETNLRGREIIIEQLTEENKELSKQFQQNNQKKEKIEAELQLKTINIDELNSQLDTKKREITKFTIQVKELTNNFYKKEEKVSQLTTFFANSKEIIEQNKIEELREQYSQFAEIITEEKEQEEISELRSQLEKSTMISTKADDIDKEIKTLPEVETRLQRKEKELKNLKTNKKDLESSLFTRGKNIKTLHDKINRIEKDIVHLKKIRTIMKEKEEFIKDNPNYYSFKEEIEKKRNKLGNLERELIIKIENEKIYSKEEIEKKLKDLLELQINITTCAVYSSPPIDYLTDLKREKITKLTQKTLVREQELGNICLLQSEIVRKEIEKQSFIKNNVYINVQQGHVLIADQIEITNNYGLNKEQFNQLIEKLTNIEQTIENKNQVIEAKSEEQIVQLSINQELTNQEKAIIKKAINLLDSKKIFLNLRQGTIDSLQACCNKFEQAHTTGKYAIIDDVSDIITSVGEVADPLMAASISVSPVKAVGGITKGVNNLFKKKSSNNNSKKIQEVLVTDKRSILLFDKYYTALNNVIWNNKEDRVSKAIIDIFDLKRNKISLFGDHDVFSLLDIWQGKKVITLEEMKESIKLLNSSWKEFETKLLKEENNFQQQIETTFKNEQTYQAQIQV